MQSTETLNRSPKEVFNQATPLENYNLFTKDLVLQEACERENAGWIKEKAAEFGELCGRAETLKLGELANRFPPILKIFDRFGNRIDEVEYHPSYHELMKIGIENGTHSLAWTKNKKGSFVARAALMFLRHQVEEGSSCPLTMTFAVVPSLKIQTEIADEWLPKVLSNEYDPRFIPVQEKKNAIFGMAMTERQGGSDVRANTTFAKPLGKRGSGKVYEINGHKWFCSAPMSDAFLTLAQTEKGLSCFLLPRFKSDGKLNAFHIQRLKDKLGNRSNASSEVEFQNANATLIGEEGRGVATIIEMVRHTRLDCAIGSAASMRKAVSESIHHCSERKAFGKLLIEQPLMKNVLADMCLESEAATAFAMRLARGFDESDSSDQETYFTRIATSIGKFWITKRAVAVVSEALECFGGNGYVEESPMPRLYRDIPLNSIWEGSGNVQCLDVLRAIHKEPQSIEALFAEFETAKGLNRYFDFYIEEIKKELIKTDSIEFRARRVVEMAALALQASILLKHSNEFVSEAFCESRLNSKNRFVFGSLDANTKFDEIIGRNWQIT